MIHVLKNDGRIVSYQLNKVSQSIIKSLRSVDCEEHKIQSLVNEVVVELHEWLENKEEITTDDIRLTVTQSLDKHSPAAAYFYSNARKLV